MEKFLAVKDTTYAVAERKPDKNKKFRLAGIRTPTSYSGGSGRSDLKLVWDRNSYIDRGYITF